MSSTVQVGGFEISSNHESAAEMVKSLTPAKDSDSKPLVKEDQGRAVEPEKAKASEAARELGKRGGEAAAKAREERGKEVAAAPDAKGEEVQDEPAEVEKRSRAQARVEQATRQLAEERRARAEEQKRTRELEERLERLERGERPREAPKAAPAEGRPKVDDFATYEEYVEALTDWKTDQKIGEREKRYAQESQQRQAIEAFSKRTGTFFERMDKAASGDQEQVKEVWPLLESLKTRDMLQAGEWEKLPAHEQAAVDLAEEIMDCDRPFEVVRFLTRNPDVYKGIVGSKDGYALRRAFGRMEAMLDREAAPAPVERRPSSAPAPLRPISPSAQPGDPDFTKEMPFDEFARLRGKRR